MQQKSTPLREPSPSSTETRTLDLYVRSLSPDALHAEYEDVFKRLDQLEATGAIDDYSVRIWGKTVSPSAARWTETGRAIWDQLDRFRSWADASGMSFGPVFDAEVVDSKITGESYSRVVLPTMALAEHVGDSLEFVAPCSDGATNYTVLDRLNALEAERAPSSDGPAPRPLETGGNRG